MEEARQVHRDPAGRRAARPPARQPRLPLVDEPRQRARLAPAVPAVVGAHRRRPHHPREGVGVARVHRHEDGRPRGEEPAQGGLQERLAHDPARHRPPPGGVGRLLRDRHVHAVVPHHGRRPHHRPGDGTHRPRHRRGDRTLHDHPVRRAERPGRTQADVLLRHDPADRVRLPDVPARQHGPAVPDRVRLHHRDVDHPRLARRHAGRLVLRAVQHEHPLVGCVDRLPVLGGDLGLHPAHRHRGRRAARLGRRGLGVPRLRPARPHRHPGHPRDLGRRRIAPGSTRSSPSRERTDGPALAPARPLPAPIPAPRRRRNHHEDHRPG